MKQLLIFVSVIIISLIAFGKYQQYKRFNSTETKYVINKNVDLNYHNKEIVMHYFDAVEEVNTYVSTQWTANKIDVIKPENDNNSTKTAVAEYAKKLAKVKYYESVLEQSKVLKQKGLSNDDIKIVEQKGMTLDAYKNSLNQSKIRSMFNPLNTLRAGDKNTLVYEVQKLLTQKGYDIPIDGVYKQMTSEALKAFEEKNKLFPDGKLDVLTLDALME